MLGSDRGMTCRYLGRTLLLALTVMAAAAVAAPGQGEPNASDIAGLLPAADGKVAVMSLDPPVRLHELTARIQAAAQSDPAWFMEHTKSATPGQPLPYDSRLGLSEAEYREYLTLGSSIGLKKVRDATLKVLPKDGGKLFLDGDDSLSDLTGLTIDTAALQVHSEFGVLGPPTRVTASDAQKATGPWNGYTWKLNAGAYSADKLVSASFSLGRFVKTNECLLYYTAKKLTSEAEPRKVTLILTYPARAK